MEQDIKQDEVEVTETVALDTVIDIESILAPINEEAPTGVDVREDNNHLESYLIIRDQRQQLRRQERENLSYDDDDDEELEAINWQPVIDSTQGLLVDTTKDIELAAWMLEGLVREKGFHGLRDGLYAIKELLSTYQQDLHPKTEEAVLNPTALQLLSGEYSPGTIIFPINLAPLIDHPNYGEVGNWHYQQALSLEKSNSSSSESGALSLSDINTAVASISQAELAETEAVLQQCKENFEALETVSNEVFAEQAPSLTNLRETILDCIKSFRQIYKPSTDIKVQTDEEVETTATTENNFQASGQMNMMSARAMLDQLTEFFSKEQPHSPITYSLMRAARWLKMDLVTIMDELPIDPQAKMQFCQIMGVPMNFGHNNQPEPMNHYGEYHQQNEGM